MTFLPVRHMPSDADTTATAAAVDPAGAEATRRAFFGSRADTDELVLGTHWEPCAGYVRSDGDVWRVEPAR